MDAYREPQIPEGIAGGVIAKPHQDPISMGAAFLGTFLIHALGAILALYFSRQPRPEPEEKPIRTIVATEIAKLGGGVKLPPELMPQKVEPPKPTPDAMADPTKVADPNKPKVQPNNEPKKPSAADLIKQNAAQNATDVEGPGDPNGRADGTADKGGKEGWEAEVGSFLKRYWTRASTISDEDCNRLMTTIKLSFDSELHIEECNIAKSSGDDIFDSSVCPAIGRLRDEKAKFPAPPPSVGLNIAGKSLKIGFKCAATD